MRIGKEITLFWCTRTRDWKDNCALQGYFKRVSMECRNTKRDLSSSEPWTVWTPNHSKELLVLSYTLHSVDMHSLSSFGWLLNCVKFVTLLTLLSIQSERLGRAFTVICLRYWMKSVGSSAWLKRSSGMPSSDTPFNPYSLHWRFLLNLYCVYEYLSPRLDSLSTGALFVFTCSLHLSALFF